VTVTVLVNFIRASFSLAQIDRRPYPQVPGKARHRIRAVETHLYGRQERHAGERVVGAAGQRRAVGGEGTTLVERGGRDTMLPEWAGLYG
jgi:hypothetical protein